MTVRLFRFVPAFFVMLVFAGCATPTPTPLPPTATLTRVIPSPTLPVPAQLPVPATDLIAAPTATPMPSLTPTISPTPTRTRTPTITATPTKTLLPSGRSARLDVVMRSTSLGMDRKLRIYLPPGYYDTQRNYPVIYMLHGYGGPHNELERWGLLDQAENLIRVGAVQPVIIVMPDGFVANNAPSYFFNHAPIAGGARWGDFIWKDVVNYIDTNYRTLPKAESRAIGGISLGGQGALTNALTHPEVFRVVGAHSPSFRGVSGWLDPPDVYFGDWDYYNQYDPFWLVKNTDVAAKLLIGIDVGLDDDKWRICDAGARCITEFHGLLVARGFAHDYFDKWSGSHDGITYWMHHTDDYLMWYSSKLVGP